MTLPILDLPTLFIVSAIAIAFSGCVLILARGDRGASALVFWGAAMLVGAAGIALLPLSFLLGAGAEAAGYLLIVLAPALGWTGARVFSGRPPEAVAVMAGPLAWLAIRTALPGREAVANVALLVIGTLYTLAAAGELWRGRSEHLRSRRAAMLLLVLHAAVYASRAMVLVAWPDFQSPRITTFLMFEAMLHTIGLAFLLLALMKERAELQATVQLREQAMHDGLTGLANRRKFDEGLDEEFRRAARDQTPLTLLMIDVDHFKRFNDAYGHQSGDDCLRAVGAALLTAVHRPADLTARYGGEEFAVLLPSTNEAGGRLVAEAIHDQVARLGIAHEGSVYGGLTVSIGAATMAPVKGSGRPDTLVRSADRALYAMKAAGRNGTRLSSRPRTAAEEKAADA